MLFLYSSRCVATCPFSPFSSISSLHHTIFLYQVTISARCFKLFSSILFLIIMCSTHTTKHTLFITPFPLLITFLPFLTSRHLPYTQTCLSDMISLSHRTVQELSASCLNDLPSLAMVINSITAKAVSPA